MPAGLIGVQAIAAGSYHTVALKDDGTVVAWGGDKWLGQSQVPAGLRGVQAIAAGKYHTIALKNDGTVVAWGDNRGGQRTVPTDLRRVTSIAADGDLNLAFIQPIGNVTITPGDADVTVGQGLTFTASIAAGAAPFTYQWRRNGVAIPKATNATLVLTNLQRSQDGFL